MAGWIKAAVIGGKKVIQDPEGASRFALGIIMSILIVVILFSSALMGLIGAFSGEHINDEFNVTQTEMFSEITQIYEEYVEKLQEEMDEIAEEYIEEYTFTVSYKTTIVVENVNKYTGTVNEIEVETTRTEERCYVEIEKYINPVNFSYIYAYFTITNEEMQQGKKVTLSKDEVIDFIETISTLEEEKIIIRDPNDTPPKEVNPDASAEPKDKIILFNKILTPEEVAVFFFEEGSKEYQMFLLSFDLYKEFIGETALLYDGIPIEEDFVGDLIYHDTGISIPHYFQTDYKNVSYGNGTISSSGCAPTCIAMIASYLTGSTITPVNVVNFVGDSYYVKGAGSSWAIFGACAAHYGYNSKNLGKKYEMDLEELQKGHPVIASMAPGVFTKGGHYIVIRGVTSDGFFLVNDPNRANLNKYGTDRFSCNTVFREAKNFWSFW